MVVRINHKKLDTEATLTTRQVAELTGYNPRTIQRYAEENLLPSAGSPHKRLFKGTDIAAFLGFSANNSNATGLIH